MRVLVTRSKADADKTASRLAARGHEAVLAPVTEIVPTGEAAPAGSWDALVVTSAHAAEALAGLTDRMVPVFAVGERTAAAVRALGYASLFTADGDARSLSGLIRGSLPAGGRLLHVAARHRKEEPAASLRAAGFLVMPWEAYEARALERLPRTASEALRSGQIGAALHYSRRSADLLIRLTAGENISPALRAFPHLCLSADVAEPLRMSGVPTRVARESTEDALLALLDDLP